MGTETFECDLVEMDLAELSRNIVRYPWLCRLMQQCQNGDYSRLNEADSFIRVLSEMDKGTRQAFVKVFNNKRYGSFTFVFRAGKCIGFDWKNLHRKPR